MVDDDIRYPVVKIVSTTSAAAVTPKLNEIFALFGIPEECRTDNCPPFQGNEIAMYAKTHGFRQRKITPLHPEVNGKVERFVRTLQEFTLTVSADGCVLRAVLPSFLSVYCSTSHTVTRKSLYFLVSGREVRGKIAQFSYSVVEDLDVRQRDGEEISKMKTYTDTKVNTKKSKIQRGDLKLLRQVKRDNLKHAWSWLKE